MPYNLSSILSRRLTLRKGFTLIELLIVITLIGILASLTLASYSGTQQKARDGVRKSDLSQVKRALELAKSDCSGNAYYPYFSGTAGSTIAAAVTDYGNLRTYLSAAALTYMSTVPQDPTNSANQQYGYNVAGVSLTQTVCPNTSGVANSQWGASNYLLAVQMERTTDADAAKSTTTCTGKPNIGNYTGAGWYFVCNN